MTEEVVSRELELAAGERFLDSLGGGPAGLLIEGEPGIGKTTIWRATVDSAIGRGYRALTCSAASTETALLFAGLADLLTDVDETTLSRLPDPQRRALSVALLRTAPEGTEPDERAVFAAFLSVLDVLSTQSPIVLAVDDAHWLDEPSARTLEFAIRRLRALPIGVLVTARSESRLLGFPDTALRGSWAARLEIGPLSVGALYHLILDRLNATLPRPLLLRLHATSGGNPFYALEIARAFLRHDPSDLRQSVPIPKDLQQLVMARVAALPAPTREALTIASALSNPSFDLVDRRALAKAAEEGLVQFGRDGQSVRFAHPLFLSAIYAAIPDGRRSRLHATLAASTADPEERARHLMLASEEADEFVSAALAEAADYAARRGAPERAAELAEEAARRTVGDGSVRWARLLRAAAHSIQAGDGDRARWLCEEVLASSPPPATRADALCLIAETCYRDRLPDAVPLLEEALACVVDDPARAARVEESLAFVAMATGDIGQFERHTRRTAELAESLNDTALLAETLAWKQMASYYLGNGFDDASLALALSLEDPERRVPLQLRPAMNAAQLYEWSGRLEEATGLLSHFRDRIVERGEESDLPHVLVRLAASHFWAGKYEEAVGYAKQALEAAELVESEVMRCFSLAVRGMCRAIAGEAEAAVEDAAEALAIGERVGWPFGAEGARWVFGHLALSRRDAREAAEWMEPVATAVEARGSYVLVTAMYLPDAIEALVASNELERAERLTRKLAEVGRRLDDPWALATSRRCHGLLLAAAGDLDGAADALERAILEHERLWMPLERARTLLALGRTRRRLKQKRLAKEALEEAREIFERIGAPLWAEFARDELARIGLRSSDPRALTETEQRVAELASSGLTNKEIAARTFLTPKSVEDVLTRVYRKLEIRSRVQIATHLGGRVP